MGKLHNELRRGPWSAAVTAALGDTREGGVERFSESLQPIMDIWSRPEWAILRREQLIYLHGFAPAVAGELSCVTFSNPDPNMILVIERLMINSASQMAVGYDARPPGAAESSNKDFLDHRVRAGAAANRRPVSQVFTDSNVATALTGPFFRWTGGVAGSNFLPGPWVILGDSLSLIIEHATANTAIVATAFGYERQLLPSEPHDNP